MVPKFFAINLFLVLLTLSTVFAYKRSKRAADHPFCYDNALECGPSHWGGECRTGTNQSPINLVETVQQGELIKLGFNQDYYNGHSKWYMKNNGHTVQVQLKKELASSLKYDVAEKGQTYKFSQLHLHWGEKNDVGSEHTVGDKSFALELHLVHYMSKYADLGDALKHEGKSVVSVIGIFIEAKPGAKSNPALETIIQKLGQVIDKSDDLKEFSDTPLNISAFFPSTSSDIFRYQGSLTTPLCAEKVLWTVLKTPITISPEQVDSFRKLKDDHGQEMTKNYRPVMPTGIRKITMSKSTLSSKPIMTDEETSTTTTEKSSSTTKKNGVSSTWAGSSTLFITLSVISHIVISKIL